MKYSIIVPCYKVEGIVDKLFDMLHSDSYSDYEVVFVDDSSPDNSYNEMISKAEKYPNYVVTRTDHNGGPGVARNKGIDLSRGEYLLFADADDDFDISILPRIDEYLLEHSDADIVVYPYIIRRGNRETNIDYYDKYEAGEIPAYAVARDSGSMCSKVFRASIIRDNDFRVLPRNSGEDKIFVVTYMTKVAKAYKASDVFYTYIMNTHSLTHSKATKECDKITTFEVLHDIYHEHFSEIELEMYIGDYLLSMAKTFTETKTSNKEIKAWFSEANKMYPNWLERSDYSEQGIYRKLIYKAMYNNHPFMIRFVLFIRRILY